MVEVKGLNSMARRSQAVWVEDRWHMSSSMSGGDNHKSKKQWFEEAIDRSWGQCNLTSSKTTRERCVMVNFYFYIIVNCFPFSTQFKKIIKKWWFKRKFPTSPLYFQPNKVNLYLPFIFLPPFFHHLSFYL